MAQENFTNPATKSIAMSTQFALAESQVRFVSRTYRVRWSTIVHKTMTCATTGGLLLAMSRCQRVILRVHVIVTTGLKLEGDYIPFSVQ